MFFDVFIRGVGCPSWGAPADQNCPKTTKIENAQKKVDQWINEHGVRYFNELTNMAILSEEVGEVARIIARKYGEQSSKNSDNEDNLADELSDVLFVLICLANQTGIDLEKSFHENLNKKTRRDKNRHKSNII